MLYHSISINPIYKNHFESQREIILIELAPNPYLFIKIICPVIQCMNMFAEFDEIPAMTL